MVRFVGRRRGQNERRPGRKRVSEWVGERLSLVYREPQETEGEGDKGGEGKEMYRGRVGESLGFDVQK